MSISEGTEENEALLGEDVSEESEEYVVSNGKSQKDLISSKKGLSLAMSSYSKCLHPTVSIWEVATNNPRLTPCSTRWGHRSRHDSFRRYEEADVLVDRRLEYREVTEKVIDSKEKT